jgi:hypothetical protein
VRRHTSGRRSPLRSPQPESRSHRRSVTRTATWCRRTWNRPPMADRRGWRT